MSEVWLTEFRAIKKTEKGTVYIAIEHPPTIDAIEVSEIEPRINDALALLDELNGEGRVEYDAYSRLHDAIGIIGERKEVTDGRSD